MPTAALAALHHREGRLEEALALCGPLQAARPTDAAANALPGTVLAQLGRAEGAVAVLSQAERMAPGDPEMLNNLAMALGAAGRPREAADRRTLRPRLQASRLCDAAAFARSFEDQCFALAEAHHPQTRADMPGITHGGHPADGRPPEAVWPACPDHRPFIEREAPAVELSDCQPSGGGQQVP